MEPVPEAALSELRRLLRYDEEDGEVYWQVVDTPNQVKVGDPFGAYDRNGYVRGIVQGHSWFMHRLIFALKVGAVPPQVDHRDGNPRNNKWDNLRPANFAINTHNQKPRGITGVKGVYMRPSGRYRVQIVVDQVEHRLGTYDTVEEAATVAQKFYDEHGITEYQRT